MIRYHRNALGKLLDQVKFASKEPYLNAEVWKLVQLNIIKKIISLENKVRDTRAEVKDLNVIRKNPSQKLTKEESIKIKAKIKSLENKLEQIRPVIDVYRSIGDAVAFTFISKLDIKPQNFKKSAGFISEKTGLKKEIETFKKIYKKGMIAVFNDITSVLKYCDLTVVYPEGFSLIEVKPDRSDMRNDSAEILSVPVPILIKTVFSFFNLLRYTLRARITNPRDRVFLFVQMIDY